ncbi:hypothetical protein SPBR_07385 [Sporothrix brasiliensis 5110]|uniref:Uncharacterized protein n=1 Tax=Sporothrix brasiliensis 5110 TaxID=1398154 RepID=A0A0C2FDH3_9PEZI|nr:uncharacterized protein SPBR_07385 [Sporothrix brasiliensis 5110]KIH89153.1 hypothetical protein SPBR_07385 [Sporothrix brasiliensis 5110]
MAYLMNHTRAVRREDLAREADEHADGNSAPRRVEHDGAGDEEVAAARAALDAYMKSSLKLEFDVRPPQSTPSITVVSSANDKDVEDVNDDESTDSSNDSGTQRGSRKRSKTQRQRSKKDEAATIRGTTEFAFRMFSGSGKAAVPVQSTDTSTETISTNAAVAPTPVVLLDDGDGSELLGPGGLLNPPRPLSFYLAGEPSSEALARYCQITVSGEDIVKASREARAWGWEVPWRARTVVQAPSKTAMRALLANALAPDGVAALPENLALALASAPNTVPSWASSQSREPIGTLPLLPQASDTPETKPKHRRPGKRHRIILRKREQDRREKAAKAVARALSKEDHLLEKKKRLNRIKKMRRREKKRAAKGDEGADSGGDDNGDDFRAN